MRNRVQRAMSVSLLAAALVAYGAFHFLPLTKHDADKGWMIWSELWELFRDFQNLGDPMTAVGVSSFLTFSLLIAAAPFLQIVWRKSRIAWWMATLFSGMAAGGFWIMVFENNSGIDDLLFGAWCLLFAPVLNCAGLLLVRGRKSNAGGSPRRE